MLRRQMSLVAMVTNVAGSKYPANTQQKPHGMRRDASVTQAVGPAVGPFWPRAFLLGEVGRGWERWLFTAPDVAGGDGDECRWCRWFCHWAVFAAPPPRRELRERGSLNLEEDYLTTSHRECPRILKGS